MQSQFDNVKSKWSIDWPGRVSRHDIVYLSPPDDPMRGIALGNGDVGALCWTEGSRLVVAMNKCDLWEDGVDGRITHVHQEKNMPAWRHACKLEIDFRYPVFDILYLDDCDGRLSLSDGTFKLAVKTPFGKVKITGRVDWATGIFCLDIQKAFKDQTPVEIQIENFGSRHMPYWYSQITKNTNLGLGGTTTKAAHNSMSVCRKLKNGMFTVTSKVEGSKAKYVRLSNHQCRAELKGEKFTLLTSVTSPMGKGSYSQSLRKLEEFSPKLAGKHRNGWKSFWMRSLMEFGDDYLDNMWHLAMYYSRSSQGGKYPGRFIDGLWGHNRDFRAWGYYFHWNQQQLYWPLNAAGHHDLAGAYLEYRFNGLENGKRDAKENFNTDGAFVADVADHRGCNVQGINDNHTPVVQIAMEFWRQYQYTQDKKFLKTRALPYMIEAAKFFESRFEKQSDGKYHPKQATSYEGWRMINDATTEIASAKSLFYTLLDVLGKVNIKIGREAKWRDIADNLAEYVILDMGEEYLNGGKYVMGRFTDEKVKYKRIISAGKDAKTGNTIVSRWPLKQRKTTGTDDIHTAIGKLEKKVPPDLADESDTAGDDGAFPGSEFSPVFPHGHIGIKDKNSELYKAAVTTAKNYSLEANGWSPLPIVLARLGLAAELSKVLRDYPGRWQVSENGWVHWGVHNNMAPELSLRFRVNKVRNADMPLDQRDNIENIFGFPAWGFRHTSLEALYVLSCAMNESLLQSWDGVIRVAPAVQKKQSARFTLHAAGGFEVSTEIENGKVKWISINSSTNNTAVIQNPWKHAFIFDKSERIDCMFDKNIAIEMKKNQRIYLVENADDIKNWESTRVSYKPNSIPKKIPKGLVQLGLGRMF